MNTILIIDDDADARVYLRHLITIMGHIPVCASSGLEGEHLAQKQTPDLILLDVMMPQQDGYVTCRHLRMAGYQGKIILMSAHHDMIGQHKADQSGADAYVLKPITRAILTAHLDSVVAQRR
jgi:DNA-binding response OmpR family regulator